MNNSKQPISPTMYTKTGEGEDDCQPLKDGQKTGWEVKFGGLTKREYYAGLAMQGLISTINVHEYKDLAEYCVNAADALLERLNK